MEFSPAHPKVDLSMTDGLSGDLIDAVAVGQLDALSSTSLGGS